MKRILALALGPALLAGCATVPPAPPAITTYSGFNCQNAPDLARAASLVPERPRALHTVFTEVVPTTPCIRQEGAPTPYVLYAIPSDPVRMIEVGSRIEFQRVFSPHVVVLDQAGNQVRTFAPDQYLYRGGFFSVQLVPQAGERYILVTANPARIGQTYEAVSIGTSTTTYWTGFSAASWTSGVDVNIARTFSYEGSVFAHVHSLERDDD